MNWLLDTNLISETKKTQKSLEVMTWVNNQPLERRMVEVNRRGFTNQFEDDSRFAEDFDHAASFVETRA
jgi:predicted nucleic acid-binding protein